MKQQKTYAVDWDGTIVDDNNYPNIGEPKPNAINVMERIINNGDRIIIWTCRGGVQENQIREKLNEYGIFDFIINDHYQDMIDAFPDSKSPKVFADYYIDDRSIHAPKGGIDWFEMEKLIFGEK